MKRIEIPITEKETKEESTIAKNICSQSLIDILKFDEEELKSITIDSIYKKLSDNWHELSRTEIMYLYNIYNLRLLCDMQTKYFYPNNTWYSDIWMSNSSVDHLTGVW